MHTEQFSLDMSDTPLPGTSTAVASLPYQSVTDEDTTVPKVSRDTNLPDDTPLPGMSTAAASLPYQSMTDEDTIVPEVSRDTNPPDDTPPNNFPLPPDRVRMYGTDVTETESEPNSEPQYMKMYQHFIKSDLKVELKCLAQKDIIEKMAKKSAKIWRKAITVKSSRPVTMKPNPAAAKWYIFKLTRYGIKRKRFKKYHYSCALKDCDAHIKNVKEWNEHH